MPLEVMIPLGFSVGTCSCHDMLNLCFARVEHVDGTGILDFELHFSENRQC